MTNILAAFDAEERFKGLARRRENFRRMVEHLCIEQFDRQYIIETGCAWNQGNWAGQGQSTLIWDWFCKLHGNTLALSFELNPDHILTARDQAPSVAFIEGDSIKMLNLTNGDPWLNQCRLLYLDSYDWTPELNLESSFHHMSELAACWRHLPSDCMVVVDDRHGNLKGKHWMVEAFMESVGAKLVFKNHQIGWLKGS